jgi:hypothetical protein
MNADIAFYNVVICYHEAISTCEKSRPGSSFRSSYLENSIDGLLINL